MLTSVGEVKTPEHWSTRIILNHETKRKKERKRMNERKKKLKKESTQTDTKVEDLTLEREKGKTRK